MKIQINSFTINGSLYKQGLYLTNEKARQGKNRMNMAYGGGLRFEAVMVPMDVKKPLPVIKNVGSSHCFCPGTNLGVDKCLTCGKTPYTD